MPAGGVLPLYCEQKGPACPGASRGRWPPVLLRFHPSVRRTPGDVRLSACTASTPAAPPGGVRMCTCVPATLPPTRGPAACRPAPAPHPPHRRRAAVHLCRAPPLPTGAALPRISAPAPRSDGAPPLSAPARPAAPLCACAAERWPAAPLRACAGAVRLSCACAGAVRLSCACAGAVRLSCACAGAVRLSCACAGAVRLSCACAGAVRLSCACAGAVRLSCACAGAVPLRGRSCVRRSTDPEGIARAELHSPPHRLRGTAKAEQRSCQHRPVRAGQGHREGGAAFCSAQTWGTPQRRSTILRSTDVGGAASLWDNSGQHRRIIGSHIILWP
ncbi:uncharacterized protein [Symphalangus syndactylus]|uniref:uncharacterized protein n=1 Tax=Symphalangus syndactylus TaxID=9590 RepID=UPI003004DF95